jgi:hypothetical protein
MISSGLSIPENPKKVPSPKSLNKRAFPPQIETRFASATPPQTLEHAAPARPPPDLHLIQQITVSDQQQIAEIRRNGAEMEDGTHLAGRAGRRGESAAGVERRGGGGGEACAPEDAAQSRTEMDSPRRYKRRGAASFSFSPLQNSADYF